ncbi:hypothetical protein KIPB_007613, partial [Kipferlia bialata]
VWQVLRENAAPEPQPTPTPDAITIGLGTVLKPRPTVVRDPQLAARNKEIARIQEERAMEAQAVADKEKEERMRQREELLGRQLDERRALCMEWGLPPPVVKNGAIVENVEFDTARKKANLESERLRKEAAMAAAAGAASAATALPAASAAAYLPGQTPSAGNGTPNGTPHTGPVPAPVGLEDVASPDPDASFLAHNAHF